MAQHYRIAGEHGLARARDGLPWRHDPTARLRVAQAAGLEVIWDLNHFDPPEDPVGHARRVAEAARQDTPLWVCPVNEPSVYPMLCGMPREAAVHLAITMGRVAKEHHPDARFLSTDPITGIGERQFAATDALVAAGLADVIGVNYYPHTAPNVAAQSAEQGRASLSPPHPGGRDELARWSSRPPSPAPRLDQG